MKKVGLLVINLDNYDHLLAPPFNKNKFNITTFYITNNKNDVETLKNLGWDNIKCLLNDKRKEHLPYNFELTSYKLYPEKIFPELLDYNILISIDGNVRKLSDIFLNEYIYSIKNYSLLLENLWYPPAKNNLSLEFKRSRQERWKKCWNSFIEAEKRYINDGFDLKNIKVCSAKYVVINMKKKTTNKYIWDFLNKEYTNHLQGNIIYAIAREKFKNEIILSSMLDKNIGNFIMKNTKIVPHNR